MEVNDKDWLVRMYKDTLEESRTNTFKRLNMLCWILMIFLFINILFTPPSNTSNYIIVTITVIFVLAMFWFLMRSKNHLNGMPDDLTHLDGESIRNSINEIRRNQQKLRNTMLILTIPFLLYFTFDLFTSATVNVDKWNLTIKLLFFMVLVGFYYLVFFRIRKTSFSE